MLRTIVPLLAVTVLGCSGAVETSTGSTGSPEGHDSGSRQGASGDGGPDGGQDDDGSTPTGSGPCQAATVQSCMQAGVGSTLQSCDSNDAGDLAWGTCGDLNWCASPTTCTTADGQPGASCDGEACVPIGGCDPTAAFTPTGICLECDCFCLIDQGQWDVTMPTCDTPLVLAFEREPVEFTRAGGAFDLVGGGLSVDTDWVGAATPWLAMDLDGNGGIDDGRELFGSMTELPDGSRARNGFEALAALDADGDGRITPKDPAFARLVVWRDADQDRRSTPGELQSAGAAGLVAIDLAYRDVPRCTGGSCEVERAHFVFRDARGREREGDVIDVHLARR
jgi:hypothetical protein